MDKKMENIHQQCIDGMKPMAFMLTVLELLPLIKKLEPDNWEHSRDQLVKWLKNDLEPVNDGD